MLKFSILIPEWTGVNRPMAMDHIDQLDWPIIFIPHHYYICP